MEEAERHIPVFFLSGFLGAGKSTLLNALLSDPAFADTAVIINEYGDVAIDHLLVRQGETAISQVSTGCLCCSGTTDLRATLFDLHCAVSGGLCRPFSRVIVEMSGLGDPAPLVNAVLARAPEPRSLRDKVVEGSFQIAGFVTLFDIITGEIVVERHHEALKQLVFADRIVLSKTDLARDPATLADIAALSTELTALNPTAEIIDRRDAELASLFSPRSFSAAERAGDVAGWLALEAVLAGEAAHGEHGPSGDIGRRSRHNPGIRTFSIIREVPIPEKKLNAFMAVLSQSAGPRLLRLKGVVNVSEDPIRPRAIHSVQHVVSEPVILDEWPDEDRRTRIVLITHDIEPEPVQALFAAVIDGRTASFSHLLRRFSDAIVSRIPYQRSRSRSFLRRTS